MDYKEKLRETYNRIAEDYTKDHFDDPVSLGIKKFVELLGSNKEVLDIGCASGIKAKILVDNGLRVTGIDLSEKMIEIAKKKVPNADFQIGDIERININKKFDGILAQACLLHVRKKDAPQIIKHWASFLKSNGILLIATKEKVKKDEDIIKENDYGYEYQRFFSFYTEKEIGDYMKEAGLEVIYSNTQGSKNSSGSKSWIQAIGRKK